MHALHRLVARTNTNDQTSKLLLNNTQSCSSKPPSQPSTSLGSTVILEIPYPSSVFADIDDESSGAVGDLADVANRPIRIASEDETTIVNLRAEDLEILEHHSAGQLKKETLYEARLLREAPIHLDSTTGKSI